MRSISGAPRPSSQIDSPSAPMRAANASAGSRPVLPSCSTSTANQASTRSAGCPAATAWRRITSGSPTPRVSGYSRARGTRSRISPRAGHWNDETIHARSGKPATTSTTAGTAAGALISMFTSTRPSASASTSARVGTRSPRPASSAASCATVNPSTGPRPSVVRSTVSSCITTGTPSALSATSSSMPSDPCAMAAANAARVFSGRSIEAPRCAATANRAVARLSAPDRSIAVMTSPVGRGDAMRAARATTLGSDPAGTATTR